jgi:hypothetical protein
LRSIAFYLPQYHPIPENDRWWGAGYTEWNRVVAARPQFRGHRIPDLPGELGFYDLRLPEVREAQAKLALSHGIDAFCYYHYWFEGKRLLERPLVEVLASGEPRLPFLVCWANEPWTRAWDGQSDDVLLAQSDSKEDWERHARALLDLTADARYFRVDGRPLILIYRAGRLTNSQGLTDTWRDVFTQSGLPEPFLCRVESFVDERGDPRPLGFDGAVEFQPDWTAIELPRTPVGALLRAKRSSRSLRVAAARHRVLPYRNVVNAAMAKTRPSYPWWRCVTPGWDNTSRRGRRATIVHGSTPQRYGDWVRWAAEEARSAPDVPAPLLFVNAWNEWSEGCHLEPSLGYGRAYLEAHARAVK